MPRCSKCLEVKPPSEFWGNKTKHGGIESNCKPCSRAYEKTPERAAKRNARTLKYQSKRPEQLRARQAVFNAVRAGELVKSPCVICGDPRSEGHHEDYEKPLSVEWLCAHHHRQVHKGNLSVVPAVGNSVRRQD